MKQHLRFFTLALLCAMCSVGWGKDKTFTFNCTSANIPSGKTLYVLSKDESPKTFIMTPGTSANEKMQWTFSWATKALAPIHNRSVSAIWQIGQNDANGEVKHVEMVTLKSVGYFKNVNKIVLTNLQFSSGGAGTVSVKVGDTSCGTLKIPGTSTTYTFTPSDSPSGQVEITIEQPTTDKQLSLKNFAITAEDLTSCGLSFEEKEFDLGLNATSFTAPKLNNDYHLSGISYYSTFPELAAVNKTNGEVTLGQANGGTATIYAFFNGNDNHKFGCTSYTINMESKPLWAEDFHSGELDGYTVNNVEVSQDNTVGGTVPELKLKKKGSSFKAEVDLQGLYGDFVLSFRSNSNKLIVETSTGKPADNLQVNSGFVPVQISNVPEGTKSLIITITSNTNNAVLIDDITFSGGTVPENKYVSWMTYCSPSALDFTEKADYYNAYIATSYKSDGNVGLTKIEKVPAGMGILVKSLNPRLGTFIFDPDSVATKENIEPGEYTNLLQGVTDDYNLPTTGTMTFNGEEVDCTNFILAKKDGVVGFYKSAGGTLKANKAYLQLPTDLISGSNSISFYVEDGTTAIQNVSTRPATTDDAWYTIQGVRVAQPTRGLYIHNGKKVVVK